MHATEKRMLRHIYGISYEDHVANTEISIQAGVKEISSFMRKRRLQRHYVGQVCQREEEEEEGKYLVMWRPTESRGKGREERGG